MKQSYADLLKKHNLPDVKQWIDVDEEMTLGDIRAAFQDKLFSFTDMLIVILRPEDITAMVEAQAFTESDHERIEALYNRLMLHAKDCVLADIAATEAEELALIQRMVVQWPSIVQEMKGIVVKTKDAYNGNKPGVHHVSYLG